MNGVLVSIFSDTRQSLIWNVMRIVGDRQIAEDLAQETYIRASKAMEHGAIAHIEALLHQTARNLAIDHLRRKATRSRVEAENIDPSIVLRICQDVPSTEEAIIGRQRLAHLSRALAGLPERTQTVMILSRVENWPNSRIADHLGISERTVFNDLKLAMGHCRDALARYERT